MITAKNDGMNEAMGAVVTMSLGKTLRYLYEERLKARRDRRAEDEYVYDQGKAEGLVEGLTRGKAEDILQFLEEYGSIPQELSDRIMSQTDLEVLGIWLKAAAKAESIEAFQKMIMDGSGGKLIIKHLSEKGRCFYYGRICSRQFYSYYSLAWNKRVLLMIL